MQKKEQHEMKTVLHFSLLRIVAGLAGALIAARSLAAPVDEAMAAKALAAWRVRRGTLGVTMGMTVERVRCIRREGLAFHVVQFAGGGVALAAAETTIRPVMLFSADADFDEDPENPVWALLRAEFDERERRASRPQLMAVADDSAAAANASEWADLLSGGPTLKYSLTSISDVRVAPFVQTRWSQKDVSGKYCFNYSTPNHWACGCVATALAQIVRYFEYPAATKSFPRVTSPYCEIDGVTTSLTTQGGCYDWSQMPPTPSGNAATQYENQRKMIGKLTSDLGILLGTSYGSGGSGAYGFDAKPVLERLGYANAIVHQGGQYTGVGDDFQRLLMSNFDARLPVMLELSNHVIVGDGYGYNGGTLYYHLNFGWSSASSTAWYAPPNDMRDYSSFEGATYNIFPTRTGHPCIASGRVLDENGLPVAGATVAAAKSSAPNTTVATAVTDERGIYAVFVPAGTYRLSAEKLLANGDGRFVGGRSATVKACVSVDVLVDSNGLPWGFYNNRPASEIGNAAQCDIGVVLESFTPEATAEIAGSMTVGPDFASVLVPVRVQVKQYGTLSSSAQVVVRLSSWTDGTTSVQTFTIAGDRDMHDFTAHFTGLTPGMPYLATVQVEMEDVGPVATADALGVSARTIPWINESAATFPNVGWRVGASGAQTAEGWISLKHEIDDAQAAMSFTATGGVDRANLSLRIKAYSGVTLDELAAYPMSGCAGLTLVSATNEVPRFAVWAAGRWVVTEHVQADETCEYDVNILVDRTQGRVAYRVRPQGGVWMDLGTYASVADGQPVQSVEFVGSLDVARVDGVRMDPNLIADANGVEYADFASALAAGATGVLTPLWSSTATIPAGRLGVASVFDPNHLLEVSAGSESTIYRTTTTEGVTRRWFCEAVPEETANRLAQKVDALVAGGISEQGLADWFITNRDHFTGRTLADSRLVGASYRLGVSTLLGPSNRIEICDFAAVDQSVRFKVALDHAELTAPSLAEMVETTTDLTQAPWTVLAPGLMTNGVFTVPVADPCRFFRIRIPEDAK